MSASYYLTASFDNCWVPWRQLGSCSVTRPFLSAKGVACETSASDRSHTCTLGQMWHKLAHWYATNYLEYANCLKLIQNPSLVPACWLCCFLQTQSTHKWRQQWRLALDVSSQISSAAGNKWICTVLWRRQGFLHVDMLPWQWTQSSPWSYGRRVIRMLNTFSRQYMCIEWKNFLSYMPRLVDYDLILNW